MEIKQFKNSLIAFDLKDGMVNATDMIKKYPNKRIRNFLRLKQTIEFINVLSDSYNLSPHSDLIMKRITGNYKDKRQQGTWMCKLLAYKFGAWLDPEFEIFIYTVFDDFIHNEIKKRQRELDYFWDREDRNDLYNRKY